MIQFPKEGSRIPLEKEARARALQKVNQNRSGEG